MVAEIHGELHEVVEYLLNNGLFLDVLKVNLTMFSNFSQARLPVFVVNGTTPLHAGIYHYHLP